MSLAHFNERGIQSGDLVESVDEQGLLGLLQERIGVVDFVNAKLDAERFITDAYVLDIWSRDYFLELTRRLKFK